MALQLIAYHSPYHSPGQSTKLSQRPSCNNRWSDGNQGMPTPGMPTTRNTLTPQAQPDHRLECPPWSPGGQSAVRPRSGPLISPPNSQRAALRLLLLTTCSDYCCSLSAPTTAAHYCPDSCCSLLPRLLLFRLVRVAGVVLGRVSLCPTHTRKA